MGKGLFQSKTFWFNLVTGVVSILATVQGSELLVNNPQLVAILGLVIGVGNVLLRLLTSEPITGVTKAK